jgi:hypothetical protein
MAYLPAAMHRAHRNEPVAWRLKKPPREIGVNYAIEDRSHGVVPSASIGGN